MSPLHNSLDDLELGITAKTLGIRIEHEAFLSISCMLDISTTTTDPFHRHSSFFLVVSPSHLHFQRLDQGRPTQAYHNEPRFPAKVNGTQKLCAHAGSQVQGIEIRQDSSRGKLCGPELDLLQTAFQNPPPHSTTRTLRDLRIVSPQSLRPLQPINSIFMPSER
jgi:hypothetical protein